MGTNKSKIYVETLIKLIELNDDPTWLTAFKNLRSGAGLPGGGAGSLNDWGGPYYIDKTQDTWYNNLYNILRFLFDGDLTPDNINSYKPIRFRNNIRILRCLNCNNKYQHPGILERHVSLDFYQKNFITFANQNCLPELLIPENTYLHSSSTEYRLWLKKQYDANSIKIYDFVTNKYICPHCAADHAPTEDDLYLVNHNGLKTFRIQKQNATWTDFENTSW